jgi:hypothetical protein
MTSSPKSFLRRRIVIIPCLTACMLVSACQLPGGKRSRDGGPWELNGVTYATSAEYLGAVNRDRFNRTYPFNARLADFRSFDDARLGLYFFHRLKHPSSGQPAISTEVANDLRLAMVERKVTAEMFDAIDESRLLIGMPLVGLYAAWGAPWNGYRTETRRGVVIQHIYLGEDGNQINVFTSDGVITAWRD